LAECQLPRSTAAGGTGAFAAGGHSTISAPKNAIFVAKLQAATFTHQKPFAHFNFFVYLYIGLNFKLT
jgi:hypothetical protein